MKRSQTEINKISKRYKKMGQIEHCHERPDMYVGNTRPERIETFLPDLKTFKFKSEMSDYTHRNLRSNSEYGGVRKSEEVKNKSTIILLSNHKASPN